MFKTVIGKEGLRETYQAEFPETIKCGDCGGEARHGFTSIEIEREPGSDIYLPGPLVCQLYDNEGKGGYWLHDSCAVAIYFCKNCLKPTARSNQA